MCASTGLWRGTREEQQLGGAEGSCSLLKHHSGSAPGPCQVHRGLPAQGALLIAFVLVLSFF